METAPTSPRKFLHTIVKQTAHIVKHGKTQKPIAQLRASLQRVKPWDEAYPKASDEAALKVMRANLKDIQYMLPGGKSPAQASIRNQFNQILPLL